MAAATSSGTTRDSVAWSAIQMFSGVDSAARSLRKPVGVSSAIKPSLSQARVSWSGDMRRKMLWGLNYVQHVDRARGIQHQPIRDFLEYAEHENHAVALGWKFDLLLRVNRVSGRDHGPVTIQRQYVTDFDPLPAAAIENDHLLGADFRHAVIRTGDHPALDRTARSMRH